MARYGEVSACSDREPSLCEEDVERNAGDRPALYCFGQSDGSVGPAEDGKYHDLEESPHPVIYLPLSQNEQSGTILVVPSRRTPGEMAAAQF
jgi:hypothetical protein